MLEVTINYQLTNTSCLNFVKESQYGDQTNCENLDCIGQLKIGQAGNLLKHPLI